MKIEELLREAGAGPKHLTPLPNYFRSKQPVVFVQPIIVQAQTLDAEFCLRYGFTESSVSALNYLHQGPSQNSLLPFLESDSFSIGNFLFRLEPGDYELAVDFVDGVTAAGYATEIRPRSLGSFLAILGLRFASEVTRELVVPLPEMEHLDELSPCSGPPLWINRKTGKLFTCSCFSYMVKRSRSQQAFESEPFKIGDYAEVGLHPGLCSICSDHVPPPKAGNPMYYSAFLQRYLPYRTLFFMKMFDEIDLEASRLRDGERVAEDAARLAVGYPMIGQKWISETTLYRTVRSLLAPRIVFQHYQGKEMDGQEIDIWVPSLKLAIEYHGEQHSQPLSVWGGEAALAAAKDRDERKRRKLKELGYRLVEFKHDEQLTDETVLERIRAYLDDST
jgi:very-short-patch-repair endonuclease